MNVHGKNDQKTALFRILNKLQLKWVKIKNFVNLSAQQLFRVGEAHNQYEKCSLELQKVVDTNCKRFAGLWRRQKLEIREKSENPVLIWLATYAIK